MPIKQLCTRKIRPYIMLFPSLFLIPEARCWFSNAPGRNQPGPAYGPTHAVGIRFRAKPWKMQRRLDDELNLSGVDLKLVLPDFRYQAEYLGIVENELCPVFIGINDTTPSPNPDEVAAIDWIDFANTVSSFSLFDSFGSHR